jgi:Ca-activated chloride channel family protein
MRFDFPWALLLLLLIPLFLFLRSRTEGGLTLGFSDLSLLPASTSLRSRLPQLPLGLRLLALTFLIIALARPQAGLEKVEDISKGVAIEMVVDRSGSMGSEMKFDGQSLSRLDVVKKVFAEFVSGNGRDLKGRPTDLIGLITFARYADTVCPLTLAHGALSGFLDTIRLVPQRSPENRTAIGDAIALAAARLQTAEETLARQNGGGAKESKSYQIKSKIIILLTDGQSNAGRHLPEEAAALAKKWGIKIYAIGVGGDDVAQVQTIFGTRMVRTGEGVDRQTLGKIAETTGGIFRMADDAPALRGVYQEIDRLEKSEIESIRYIDYKEYFVPFALAALILLSLETILRCTLWRRLP